MSAPAARRQAADWAGYNSPVSAAQPKARPR